MKSEKVDLSVEVVPGVTYRAVRDALKRVGARNFHQDDLALALRTEEISAAYCTDCGYRAHKEPLSDLRRIDAGIDRGDDWAKKLRRTVTAIKAARRCSAQVCKQLHEKKFIQPYEHRQGRERKTWDRGSTLLAQKALKRISRGRAQQYVSRAIEVARAYNDMRDANYSIDKIYLFGSMLSDEESVGDVDLLVLVKYLYPSDTFEEKLKREKERCKDIRKPSWHFMGFYSTEREGPQLIDAISPYISVVARADMLRQLEERGEPFKLIFEAKTSG